MGVETKKMMTTIERFQESPVKYAAKKRDASGQPITEEIAYAKANGLVWTNPTTKVYHRDGEFYGRTKNGRFMTQAEAVQQYYRAAPGTLQKN